MKHYWSLYQDTAKFWSDLAQTSIDTTTTLSHRLPMLAGLTPAPSQEMDRMVTEKVKAISEGMMDASWTMGREMMKAAFNKPTVTSMANASLAIANASLAPGRRTVKSNAKRLSNRKHG